LNRLVGPNDWLWMMTGTPAAQGPMDAFGLARLVNPKEVPRTAGAFRNTVMFQKTRYRWEPKPTAIDTVHRVLQPAIRFTKDECLDLPDMVYVKRNVPMTKQQESYYKKLKKDFVLQLEDADVTTVNAAVNMNKLLQISAGAVYTDNGDTVEFDISARYNVLREAIDESSHKVLVFVPFKSTIRMLSERLTADGVPTEVISGEVSAGKRSEIFKAFQTTPNPQVIVIQPQSQRPIRSFGGRPRHHWRSLLRPTLGCTGRGKQTNAPWFSCTVLLLSNVYTRCLRAGSTYIARS
jgi:hypothetical protein